MKLVKRLLSKKLSKYLKLFPVVAIIGPRQAGKVITRFVPGFKKLY
jgi:predicted AAA+ superfamily ATPase